MKNQTRGPDSHFDLLPLADLSFCWCSRNVKTEKQDCNLIECQSSFDFPDFASMTINGKSRDSPTSEQGYLPKTSRTNFGSTPSQGAFSASLKFRVCLNPYMRSGFCLFSSSICISGLWFTNSSDRSMNIRWSPSISPLQKPLVCKL